MKMGCRKNIAAISAYFLALWLGLFAALPAYAEHDRVIPRVELDRIIPDSVTKLPDVQSFRKPMSACMLVLGLFKSRLPNMRQYRRLFHGFNVTSVSRPIKGKLLERRTESTVSAITPDNIERIFTHQYDSTRPNQFGAKGLLYFDPDGKMRAIMWPTGMGVEGNNIHHKDAVASVIETEATDLTRVVRELENKGDLGSGMLALDLAQELHNVAENLHHNRRQDSFTEEMLHRFQGFQLTATRDRSGKLHVTKVQISSSVTSTQISRHEPLLVEELNKGLALIRDSIDPELRRYGRVEIDGLSRMELDHPEELGVPGERPPIQTPPAGSGYRKPR